MDNTTLLIIGLIVLYGLSLCQSNKEPFSNSGLNMSDRRCVEMAGWYNPEDNNHENRAQYVKRLCFPDRKHIIDEGTGNYFNAYGSYTLPVNHMNSKYI